MRLVQGSLVPRPLPTQEKGLVHTDCACARLYPESGYIVYSRKIHSKLSIYDYVIFSNSLAVGQQTRGECREFVRAVDRQGTSKKLTQALVSTRSRKVTW